MPKEILVSMIRDGTVIDHIPQGRATCLFDILGLGSAQKNKIALLINTDSKSMGRKDIMKIEDKELSNDDISIVSLIAPKATINLIKNYKVIKKTRVEIPKRTRGTLICPNNSCITNNDIEAITDFALISKSLITFKCMYCGAHIEEGELFSHCRKR
jgi:aspartate carbamoyltransferase regulatory subunit